MFHPIGDSEHPLLYLPGTGIASQETAISGSFQQHFAGIYASVWGNARAKKWEWVGRGVGGRVWGTFGIDSIGNVNEENT